MAVTDMGLTIKFGGDTTELQGALKKVQGTAKDTQGALKDINRALKLDPGNTELLTEKAKLLNRAYDETKAKLDAYKSALAGLEEKQRSGAVLTEREQAQYSSLKAQIAICENQLESYADDLKNVSREAEASKTGLYQFGQTIQDNSDKLAKAGKGLETAGKTITGAVGGAATALVGLASSQEENIEQAKDIWFYEYFSPLSGVQTQIPILFSEYAFAEKQDVEDCLTLLEESGAYMDCLLEVEQRRAEKGYFMSDASVDIVVEQCEDFLSGDENCILTVLRDNIQAFDTLTDEEKTAYIDRAAAAVENQLIPAYQRLISKLQELKGSRSVADGLANYEGGKEYYEKLLRSEVGTERTPEELIQMTEDQINQDAVEFYMILMMKSSLQDQLDSYEFLYSDPEEILD